jgi:hypothetical protein
VLEGVDVALQRAHLQPFLDDPLLQHHLRQYGNYTKTQIKTMSAHEVGAWNER